MVGQGPGVLRCYLFGQARSCTYDAVPDLVVTFSSLWKISVLCPGGSFSFLDPQKLIRSHYASQGPAKPQLHASQTLYSQPHPLIFFDCFSFERATCPWFHSCCRQSNNCAALRPGLVSPTAIVVPTGPNSRCRRSWPSKLWTLTQGSVLKSVKHYCEVCPCRKS